MRDIARVDDERGLLGEAVDDVDRAVERADDVRICLLVEADVAVADLHEERLSESRSAPLVSGRHREIDRSKHAPGEGEECAGAAKSEALERPAPRSNRGWV